jgi:hypothetical protein
MIEQALGLPGSCGFRLRFRLRYNRARVKSLLAPNASARDNAARAHAGKVSAHPLRKRTFRMASKNPAAPRPALARFDKPPAVKRRHFLRRFWLPAILLLAIAAGGLTGMITASQINTSRAAQEVASLATYRPSEVTRSYADDGETVIGEFELEKRIPLKYE